MEVPLYIVINVGARRRVVVVSLCVCLLSLDLSKCKVLQNFEEMFIKLMMHDGPEIKLINCCETSISSRDKRIIV